MVAPAGAAQREDHNPPPAPPAAVPMTLPPPVVPGLTSDRALALLAEHGPNELGHAPRVGLLRQLLRGLGSPLMLILLAASAVAASVGEITDATIIFVTVLLGTALDAFQTSRSTAAVDRLRQSVIPTATVWRDERWLELPRRALVPGDVIHLSAGDMVPADAWLVSSRDLHVQQAALTGESFPAEKEAPARGTALDSASPRSRLTDPNTPDGVFLGTSIVSGVGVAIVNATGARTAFGEIAARLRAAPPPTDLERGLRRFGALLARTVVFLVLFLVLVEHRAASRSIGIAVVRRRAGGRCGARVHAHGHVDHPGDRCRSHVASARDRQAPRGNQQFWKHRRALQRQDRHADTG